MKLSSQLREKRKALNLTQQDLADQLHVTRQTLSCWENDLSYPNLDTLVQLSQILDLSLDNLLKGESNPMVTKISSDVRTKKKYKRSLTIVGSVLILIALFLILLAYGRATQNSNIDRVNPFLETRYGYAILPTPSTSTRPGKIDTFVSDDPFGQGSWLKFHTGEYNKKNRWALVKHKGSYVVAIRLVNKKQIPLSMREQAGSFYTKYHSKNDGSRTGKQFSWWPFD